MAESTAGRVTITRPPVVVPRSSLSSGLLVPPIGPAYVAASLRQAGYQVSMVDPVGEDPFEINPVEGTPLVTYGWSLDKTVAAIPADTRFVGISALFSHEWPVTKDLANRVRARFPEAVVIAGGEHITAAPEFSLRDCPAIDYAVLGEAEETVVELISTVEAGEDTRDVAGIVYLEDGVEVRTTARTRIRTVDEIPWPAWDLVPLESYLANGLSYGVSPGRSMPINATRGCPYQCTFCSNPAMWTQRWYPRRPTEVVDEIASYVEHYQADNFDFYDLTAIIKKDWIVEFCSELIDRELEITWQLPAGTRSEAIDDEVAALLARSGHRNLVYAPETGSERMLKIIKKRVNLDSMLASMKACMRNGISVKMNMIVGFPEETPADIFKTYRFLVRTAWAGVDDATIATFSPYPGSALFDDLVRDGVIEGMDDDFFYGLATMGDVKTALSFARQIGGKALLRYKLFGILLFYAMSHLRRPWRIVRLMRNLARGDHQTRLEKALSAFIAKNRRGPQAGVLPG